MLNAYLDAINKAEELLGHPPTLPDIIAVLLEHDSICTPIKNGMLTHMVLMNLLREDLVYTDPKHMHKWTTKPREGYCTFSEFWRQNNKGYTLDTFQRCIALPETKTVNLTKLMAILRSKDPSLLEENSWMFDGQTRLLDGAEIPTGQKVAFDTWPRTGNSFLRKFIEQITGIYTGANMPLNMTSMQHC